jgi:uncharacterized protein YcaQ
MQNIFNLVTDIHDTVTSRCFSFQFPTIGDNSLVARVNLRAQRDAGVICFKVLHSCMVINIEGARGGAAVT